MRGGEVVAAAVSGCCGGAGSGARTHAARARERDRGVGGCLRRVWRARSRVRWRASWLRERERALSSGASARLAVWCRVSERRSEEQASRMLAQAHSPQKSDTSPPQIEGGWTRFAGRPRCLFAVCLWPFAAAAAAAAAGAERRTSNSSSRKVGEARSTRLADRREWADSGGAGWAGADGGDVERRERRTVCRPSERLPSGRSDITSALALNTRSSSGGVSSWGVHAGAC